MKRYLFSISAFRLKKMNAFLVLKTMILPLYFKCTYFFHLSTFWSTSDLNRCLSHTNNNKKCYKNCMHTNDKIM